METSDSEDYFESADEDFLSEEELDKNVKPAVPLPRDLSIPEKSENKSTKVALNEYVQDTGIDKVEKNDNKNDTSQALRAGFAKAPKKVDCWFPDVNENKLDNQPKQISGDVINKPTCEMTRNEETEKIALSANRIDNVVKDSDNATVNKGLELNIEEENVIEDDGWDNWNEEVVEQVTETVDVENKESSDDKPVTKSLEENLKSEEENEVEDDWNNWKEEDTKPMEKNELQKECEIKTKSKKQEETKPNVECNIEDTDDLWGDDEDWGAVGKEQAKEIIKKEVNAGVSKINVVSKETEEDDLWGDDEDWGVDIKPKQEVVSQINVNDDLWGEEDNWGVEEDDDNVSAKKVDVEENMWNEISNESKKGSLSDITKPLDNIVRNQNLGDNSWGGWGNWGKSVLSTAANLTNQVSQGLTTVIGIPDPEELAKQHKAEKQIFESAGADVEEVDDHSFGLSNFVSISKITKLVENTGTKVISGGLDTLETIGKKTMQVLQENDPGLKKKRAFLKIDQDRPVLSQILREAKEKAAEDNKVLEKPKQVNYEMIFDDYQGLVHLEALEMLSRQCDIKVQSVISKTADAMELQETMDQIKALCDLQELDDDDDSCDDITELKSRIDAALEELNVPVNYKNLFKTLEENDMWISAINYEEINEHHVHHKAIETLATITALIVEQFHKIGELVLVKSHRSTADEADSLVQLTTTLSGIIGTTSSKYSEILNNLAKESSGKISVNELITNVFFEAANSSRYIEDAFQLLIPVIQVGAI
ncbi:PREDICTED: protein FAM114A2 [Nicrophorus vespilloides]|uniref:Protein FAM114A2 n=1 Tax=Nicrophorus vespilloides TaxID=110193 RepID=A0ABM1MD71_NICVS|nr:PREDICTED: protein FAM114A2 [Nicrophorus vespilloides]